MGNGDHLSWYRDTRMNADELHSAIARLADLGLLLPHPALGHGVLLNVEGDQVPMPTEQLVDLLALHLAPLTFQLWLDADTDMVCTVRYPDFETQQLSFVLDGLLQDERAKVETAVHHLADRDRTLAVLTDPGGWSPHEADDELALHGRLPGPGRPHRLRARFPTERLAALGTDLTGAAVTDFGDGWTEVRPAAGVWNG